MTSPTLVVAFIQELRGAFKTVAHLVSTGDVDALTLDYDVRHIRDPMHIVIT
jgi:hypothetical protein